VNEHARLWSECSAPSDELRATVKEIYRTQIIANPGASVNDRIDLIVSLTCATLLELANVP
jgi:hypothetical protein